MTWNATDHTIAAILDRHRALAVLRVLAGEDCTGSAPEGVLADVLDTFGLGCARAKLRACLAQLERSGLVSLTSSDNGAVVRLTHEGDEVARGRCGAEGVQPLSPGEN